MRFTVIPISTPAICSYNVSDVSSNCSCLPYSRYIRCIRMSLNHVEHCGIIETGDL